MTTGKRQTAADSLGAPHRTIEAADPRERFTLELFDALWGRYRERVSYVQQYEQLVQESGATFVNDHIAFRTFGCQRPNVGIHTLSRIFEALGYQAAGCYRFVQTHLGSIHFQHPNPMFPKLFITELKTWELSPGARKIIARAIRDHREPLETEALAALSSFTDQSATKRARLLRQLVNQFHQLPWKVPAKRDIEALAGESQFAAWVLVHGYNVNHFTALINSHGAGPLSNIEKTSKALAAAGVPMKSTIEGEAKSKLRQTATEAVMIDVNVRSGTKPTTMPWTYAYFELAERGLVRDLEGSGRARFEGFLGPQATQLFEMTRVKS